MPADPFRALRHRVAKAYENEPTDPAILDRLADRIRGAIEAERARDLVPAA